MKIAKFRKEKETYARIALLEKQIDESGDGSGTTTDIEEEIRELSILRIQSRARFACDELGLIIQEIQLLDHMSDLRELEEEFGPSTGSGTGTGCTGNSRVPVAGLPSPPSSSSSMKESPGLTVTRTQNIDGQLVMTRETIKGSVFQPRMAGPTISVEQFGDMELRRMREQEAMAKERGAVEDGPVLKYNELCAEGKEDESDLVDKVNNELFILNSPTHLLIDLLTLFMYT